MLPTCARRMVLCMPLLSPMFTQKRIVGWVLLDSMCAELIPMHALNQEIIA